MQLNNHFYGPVYYVPLVGPGSSNGYPEGHAQRWFPNPPPPLGEQDKLVADLIPHILPQEQMWAMGYPLHAQGHPGRAVFYVNPPGQTVNFTKPENDAGASSASASTDENSDPSVLRHVCVRCGRNYQVSVTGEYVVKEKCKYHWGRITYTSSYSCCQMPFGSEGCSECKYHVWNGSAPGHNGPFDGYVHAVVPRGGVYAIDTDMCYTAAGLELVSLTVINAQGQIVYKTLVKPTSKVLDCNTRFSGVRMRDLACASKTLQMVQEDLLKFVGMDTILIGHALENDLRALKLIHLAVVDTSAMYPHPRGYPMRKSLRMLSEEYLGRPLQTHGSEHSSVIAARAALDLVLRKIDELRPLSASMTPPDMTQSHYKQK